MTLIRSSLSRSFVRVASLAAAAGLLAGCGSAQTGAGSSNAGSSSSGSSSAGSAATAAPGAPGTAKPAEPRHTTEVEGRQPRLGITYDGGVAVVDGTSLAVLATFPLEGFTRLNLAGDGRRLLVTEKDAFRLLDLGAWTKNHGDHGHSYTKAPLLTPVSIAASHPGHVVTHADRTALFADGTGDITVYDPQRLDDTTAPPVATTKSAAAHHGVAVPLEGGGMLRTIGTEEKRSGALVTDASGRELTRNEQCPGVHGEATAAGGVVTVGCEDGILVYAGGRFTKVAAPDAYGRIGNQAGSPASPVVLGDYKVDKGAELERPTRITLTDTKTRQLKLVDLGSSYSFRSLERGPKGEALVLTTDGRLTVVDPTTGAITSRIPVVQPWTESTTWQHPRPAVRVVGSTAYVTDPARRSVHAVDLTTSKVTRSGSLGERVPNEIAGTRG